jgi:DNA repair photolyase
MYEFKKNKSIRKGRGAQVQVKNRFDSFTNEQRDDFLEYCRLEGENAHNNKTKYVEVFPKTIVNKVNSPDVGMEYSLNPYQGCEHGCVYCYARNTHEYWGYNAGLDFEKIILIKKNAASLLENKLKSKTWKACPIVLSGNTDCYQPAEQKYRITRACLQIFFKYRHPVGIITKNAAILKDLDVLKELAEHQLIKVNVSITSLSEETRMLLEPRTASIKKRLHAISELTRHSIPVNVMVAPIIPGINSHEILPLAKAASDAGAVSIGFTVVRLNGAIGQVFTDWITKAMPDKAQKVLNQIAACHGGSLNDSRFGIRNRGEGKIASQIHRVFKVAKQKYFKTKNVPSLNCEMHATYKDGQMKLF